MQQTKFYTPTDKEEGKELEIAVSYSDWRRKGLHVDFTLVKREEYAPGRSSIAFELAGKHNFSEFAVPMSRRNQKKQDKLAAYVEQHHGELAAAFETSDRGRIKSILQAFA
jgi:hypothetical protein